LINQRPETRCVPTDVLLVSLRFCFLKNDNSTALLNNQVVRLKPLNGKLAKLCRRVFADVFELGIINLK